MIIRFSRRKSSDSPWTLRDAVAGLFFAAGCLALGYSGVMYFEAAVYQAAEASRLDNYLSAAKPLRVPDSARQGLRRAVANGSPFGRIEIPRIGVSAMVIEGVTARNLRVAVGHIPGTALPGDSGNVAIAGHRDSFFRNLLHVRMKDTIVVTTLYGEYQYSVMETRIVQPDDVSVVGNSGETVLTLITCYPFHFAGPAPKRFIVLARPSAAVNLLPVSAAPVSAQRVAPAPRPTPNRRLLDLPSWFEIARTWPSPEVTIE